MSKKKKGHGGDHVDESWLLPYSDMMTLLLALFIVMFASSNVDQEKYNAVMESMFTAFGGTTDTGSPTNTWQISPFPGDSGNVEDALTFSDLYVALEQAVEETEYMDYIEVINGEDAITVRFSESVLFTPDSAVMTSQGNEVLQVIGTILVDLHSLIGHIQIEGHTAFIGEEADRFMTAWELSSDRAIVVLEYLTFQIGFDQSQLNVAGYSHFVPVASNDTEDGRSRNRRVELRITPEIAPLADRAETASQQELPFGPQPPADLPVEEQAASQAGGH